MESSRKDDTNQAGMFQNVRRESFQESRAKVHLREKICGSASEKELLILGCFVGRTLGLYAAPSRQAQSEPLRTMQGATFALECTHIRPASAGAAQWQNVTALTLKQRSPSGFMRTRGGTVRGE